MKPLPGRRASYSYPIPFACGDLVPTEETVALWLRAFPSLLGWRPTINWLWPGVVDWRKKCRPSLCGFDGIGSRIIVEIAIDRGDAPDPFEGFVSRLIHADSDQRSIERSLDLYNGVWSPPTVIVGVIATTQGNFRLSEQALENFALLQKHLGRERVLLRLIGASLTAKGLRIHCRDPQSKDRGRSVTTPIY
jgi:hypothetical protein